MNRTTILKSIIVITHFFSLYSKTADLVIFSYNRPMQLYALLESIESYVTGIGDISIIYRASTPAYQNGYAMVQNRFPAQYIPQCNPPYDFKPLTVFSAFESSKSDYILFAVDDIIVKDAIDLSQCIEALESHQAYGFYLRLGLHLDTCYMLNCPQPIPPYSNNESVYSWIFQEGLYDWGYPNTVDMTVYKKSDIKQDLIEIPYESPNQMEAHWAHRSKNVMNKTGLFFQESKIINIPLNRVQTDYNNRFMDEYTPEELLDLFIAGYIIDISPFWQKLNHAAHEPILPTFKTTI